MAEAVDICADVSNPLDLLKRFYTLQEERVEAYRFLESGFTAYLAGAPDYNFDLYRNLVHEITQSFKTISEEVLGIEQKFRDVHDMGRMAECIKKVQLEEKEKLDHTVQLQLSRQGATDNPDDACQEAQVNTLQENYCAKEEIVGFTASGAKVSDGEEQITKGKIQETVQRINDQMEDLKYESEELYSSEGAER